ncbi:DUF6268 family outer membrane beta-barrel protein [Lacinutrix sp. 5H-3-7-4]|uniref:DUF6268 family outer membrane beta-barrel protein n=1 Tax=Lacinutrix sp. (strain 5H-3-7-4) TaxID=983544 RepID=UPI00020A3A10|nr:DUF6268 family outer membrane beta-barrel protein [Lacinutrix sp. 5H-3-7-4]AEH00104.1 hypothetical protein Lacal_0251 [Lacinutrix sp. 5H-3-7-4]
MLKENCLKLLLTILIIISFQPVSAQLTDLARIEYSYIPKGNSEDSFKRFRTLLNYPIELKNDSYLIIGGEYSNIDFDIEDHYPFETNNLSQLHIIDFNLAYTFKVSEKWRLGAKIAPRIASTLREKIGGDDIFLNGGVYAVNDRTKDESAKKPYRLIVGLTYNSTAGIPLPLPFVSYYRRVNKHWSFNLGIPKTNVKYFFNEKNIVQLYTSIDGYFANIQGPLLVNDQQADNISLSVIVTGLGYEYCFTKNLLWYAYTGYTLSMNNRLRDSDREEVFKLDNVNTLYFRSGIKFKI